MWRFNPREHRGHSFSHSSSSESTDASYTDTDNSDEDQTTLNMAPPVTGGVPLNPPQQGPEATDLAAIITGNTRDNFAKVSGLNYFNGLNKRKHSDYPTLELNPSIRGWIGDIDSRTQENWTDRGKIELAKMYALGRMRNVIVDVAEELNYKWADVKDRLFQYFPSDKTYAEWCNELSTATRQTGETLFEFFIRLDELRSHAKKVRPNQAEALNITMSQTFSRALPQNFIYTQDAHDTEPLTVYKKAVDYVKNYPSCKLSDEDIEKEKSMRIRAVTESPVKQQKHEMKFFPPKPSHTPFPRREWEKNVICFACGRRGHIARDCRIRYPTYQQYRQKCTNCGMNNHTVQYCRNSKKNPQNYWTNQ